MDLDDENRRLRAALAERDAQIADHRAEITDLRERLAAAEEAAQRLQRDIEKLKRQLIGPRSERLVDPETGPIPTPPDAEVPTTGASEPGTAATPTESDTEPETKKEKRQRKAPKAAPHGRRDLSAMDDLAVVTIEGKVGPMGCRACGRPLKAIGPLVTWRLEQVPAHFVRHKIVLEQCACPDHPQLGVTTAACPQPYALPRAMCGNRLLAQIAVDKYADHLPLNRQSGRFEREGVSLAVATLSDWMMALGELVGPIADQVAKEVRSGDWLRSDATGLPVRDEKLQGRTHHGHLWCYGNHEQVVFAYTDDKKAPTVAEMFAGFRGTVVVDGASDFNLLEATEGVERAGCWAHARRYFYEALSTDAQRATVALTAIRKLFLAERLVMSAPEADRLRLREETCSPIVDGFKKWLDEIEPTLEPRNPLHAAVQYTRNQWQRLQVFLQNARIPAHNNDSERDLRKTVTGRKNWLVAGSARGARMMARHYTLIGSCLLQGIDPRAYLVEILGRLDEPPRRLTPAAIREQWETRALEASLESRSPT